MDLDGFPLVAAGFTTLCCLGFAAALSLATALGATFLTKDDTRRPILAVTLALTVAGSAFTYWRHRSPGSLVITIIAAVWVYAMTYLVDGSHGQAMDDGMGDSMADHGSAHGGLSGARLVLIWIGLGLLVAAQVWDIVRIRHQRMDTHREPAET